MTPLTSVAVNDEVLDPRDACVLRMIGEVSGPNDRGLIRIHKKRLDKAKSAIFRAAHTSDPNSFCWIPTALVSPATLLYLGFSEVATEILWARWVLAQVDHQHQQQQQPSSSLALDSKAQRGRGADGRNSSIAFINMALAEITSKATPSSLSIKDTVADGSSSEEQWIATLDWYGLNEEICEALLNPEFACMRDASDQMVKQTMVLRFEALKEVQSFSEQRALLVCLLPLRKA